MNNKKIEDYVGELQGLPMQVAVKRIVMKFKEFESENKKLRACVEFYASLDKHANKLDSDIAGSKARQCLKELENL